jgi:hypothetical protein
MNGDYNTHLAKYIDLSLSPTQAHLHIAGGGLYMVLEGRGKELFGEPCACGSSVPRRHALYPSMKLDR